MRVRLAEARRKLVDISARNRAAKAQHKFVEQLPSGMCTGAATSNFEKLCTRVEQSEAETEALLELLGESNVNEAFDADVEAELQSLQEKASHVAT